LGAYESKVVYVNTAASTDGIVEVAGLEYFFDTDPGLGLGTQIATDQALSVSLSNSLNTSGLTKGFHTLYLRGKTPAGRWGAYESKVVYVQPNVPATLLTNRAEYFFDTDPGVGQATQVTFTSTQELNTSINIASQALTKGAHKLYLRAKAEKTLKRDYQFLMLQLPIHYLLVAGLLLIYQQKPLKFVAGQKLLDCRSRMVR
jgi:hypothetical protein